MARSTTNEQLRKRRPAKDGSICVCRCECGGWVRGVFSFGYLWTWCMKCSPVEVIDVSKLNRAEEQPHG